jgi:hypothetical protein
VAVGCNVDREEAVEFQSKVMNLVGLRLPSNVVLPLDNTPVVDTFNEKLLQFSHCQPEATTRTTRSRENDDGVE